MFTFKTKQQPNELPFFSVDKPRPLNTITGMQSK